VRADVPGTLAFVESVEVKETAERLRAAGGGYEVGVYVLVAPEPDRQQPHDFDEMYVVIEGTGVLEVEGDQRRLREGEALYVPAGAEHRFTAYEQLALLVIFNGYHHH
jgi:mannose-6-phosphate isomerase-like protein (cupin superfamily)